MGYSYEQEVEKINKDLAVNGVPEDQCLIIADCFATADLYGVTSHGISVLPSHIERIKRGGYNLHPSIKVIEETNSFAVIDGDNAIGPVSADYYMKYASKKAGESGIFTVFGRNNNTFGPAFYYPLHAAKEGLIGMVFSNSPAQMAPFGGKSKMLGTNPFSIVIPRKNDFPIILDMATSIVAKPKFLEYKEAGKELPKVGRLMKTVFRLRILIRQSEGWFYLWLVIKDMESR
jgi:LDH2 family malate/lactate/ureidoglycolate dehydrogenase